MRTSIEVFETTRWAGWVALVWVRHRQALEVWHVAFGRRRADVEAAARAYAVWVERNRNE